MKSKWLVVVCAIAVPVAPGALVHADGLIPDRATLDAILVDHQTLEDFETFDVDDGDGVLLDTTILDDTMVANGQGPNLVEPGVLYRIPSRFDLQWNGPGYFGLETKTFTGAPINGEFEINYTGRVTAFGLDLRGFEGFGYDGVVEVYDTDNVLISSTPFTINNGGTETLFFGWEHSHAIGRVVLINFPNPWSPIIDNHGYGSPCPWDLNGDAIVGTGDLIVLLGSWGDPYGTADLIQLLGAWGPCR